MTLHEIEQTLHTLQSRHAGLDEDMLVTLLRGGGWEEKNIQEAIFLFRSGDGAARAHSKSDTEMKEGASIGALPSFQTEPVLMPQSDEKHLLLDHNEEASPYEPAKESVSEPQSLVQTASEPASSKKEEFPHNLPLRPFETSEHIWPFSRYRDVFYGDAEPIAERGQENKRQEASESKEVPKEEARIEPSIPVAPVETNTGREDVIKEEKPQAIFPAVLPEKEIVPVPLTRGDEKLVILASVMLLAVLLLLGYMYSNGRL